MSALTHGGAGVGVWLTAWALLLRARGDMARLAAVGIFVAGVGTMLTFSGTYHGLPQGHSLKVTFWHLDHASIWIGLASAHTPIQVLFCPPETTRRRLSRIWSVACVGLLLEVTLLESLPLWVSPLLYIGMGWVCFPVLLSVYRTQGRWAMFPLLFAGCTATLGGLIDSFTWPNLIPGLVEAHELAHVALCLAGYVYWRMVLHHADGRAQPAAEAYEGELVPAPALSRRA